MTSTRYNFRLLAAVAATCLSVHCVAGEALQVVIPETRPRVAATPAELARLREAFRSGSGRAFDVVNRRDLATDFLDPDRLGELGVRYRRFFTGGETLGEPTVSLYLLPVWRETLFAPEDQRFSFDTPAAAFDEDAGFEPEGSERLFYALRFAGTLSTGPVNADVQLLARRMVM